MNRLRIGVFGAGVLGCYHIDKCLRSSRVECAGVHDIDPNKLEQAARSRNVAAFSDPDSLIGCIDAAIVATPCSSHPEVVMRCLGAGKHVLVEKPLAPSYDEGRELVETAAQKGVVLHVGHSEFHNPAFTHLLSFKPNPRFMEIHRLAAFSPRGTDVAVILDLMIHDLHLAMRLCGQSPELESVAATGVAVVSPGIDIANVRLRFPSGCVANLTASRISMKKMRKLRLFQHQEYFSVDLETREVVHCRLEGDAADNAAMRVGTTKDVLPAGDALETELTAFVDAVAGLDTPAVTGAEGLEVLRVSDAILAAL